MNEAACDPNAWGGQYERCLSCNACRAVCTMQVASGRLPPLRLVRMAALGMGVELMSSPEPWYCLRCNRCSQTCPVGVAPAWLLRELRIAGMRDGVWSESAVRAWETIAGRVHRVRWHMVKSGATGDALERMAEEWERWGDEPISRSQDPVVVNASANETREQIEARAGVDLNLSACMTCGACSSVCPATHDRAVFDPVVVFRMANVGCWEELLSSTSLWMCLQCGACTDACTQGVAGHRVIRALQELAICRGVAPADVMVRLQEIDGVLYPRMVRAVDAWFARYRA